MQGWPWPWPLAGSVGASSKRLSWTTKLWSSQILTACAPLDTTVSLVPPHSISNPRCLVVLWIFAVPMSGSNQFYGTDAVSHFHPNLVSSVVPCALANPTNSIQSGGQIRGQQRMKRIRLCTAMQLQNVQNRFVWVMVAIIVWNLQIKIFRQICEAITSNTNVQMYIKITTDDNGAALSPGIALHLCKLIIIPVRIMVPISHVGCVGCIKTCHCALHHHVNKALPASMAATFWFLLLESDGFIEIVEFFTMACANVMS